jgi:MFS family permease
VSLAAAVRLLRQPVFRRVCLVSTLLAVITLSDAFIYLLLQRRLDVAIAYFPLFPIGTSSVYLVFAVPMGRLADRFGGWRVFLGGNVAMLCAYLFLLSSVSGVWLLVLVLGSLGLYYAATNGVLMALAAPQLPEALRTSGLALVQSGTALASFASSIAFGALWSVNGPTAALKVFAVLMTCALGLAAVLAVRSRGFRPSVTT